MVTDYTYPKQTTPYRVRKVWGQWKAMRRQWKMGEGYGGYYYAVIKSVPTQQEALEICLKEAYE